MKASNHLIVSLLAATTVLGTSLASASIVQTNQASNTSQTAFPLASAPGGTTNLISGMASVDSGFTGAGGSNTAALTNNTHGTNTSLPATGFDTNGIWTSTYTFDTTLNTAGYDLVQVDTFAGWTTSRSDQKYELFYSTVSAPSTFISLGIFHNYLVEEGFGPSYPAISNASTHTKLSSSGGPIVSNMKSLRFSVMAVDPSSVSPNPETVFREWQAFGSPTTVPEAATGGLLSIGIAAALRRRTRR
ncbi:MAG: hypothetical protein IT444_10530 [Phycisphaeraceae bacterium]|nr:hypothetical protein [Phycisphaeraceae bacterium]